MSESAPDRNIILSEEEIDRLFAEQDKLRSERHRIDSRLTEINSRLTASGEARMRRNKGQNAG